MDPPVQGPPTAPPFSSAANPSHPPAGSTTHASSSKEPSDTTPAEQELTSSMNLRPGTHLELRETRTGQGREAMVIEIIENANGQPIVILFPFLNYDEINHLLTPIGEWNFDGGVKYTSIPYPDGEAVSLDCNPGRLVPQNQFDVLLNDLCDSSVSYETASNVVTFEWLKIHGVPESLQLMELPALYVRPCTSNLHEKPRDGKEKAGEPAIPESVSSPRLSGSALLNASGILLRIGHNTGKIADIDVLLPSCSEGANNHKATVPLAGSRDLASPHLITTDSASGAVGPKAPGVPHPPRTTPLASFSSDGSTSGHFDTSKVESFMVFLLAQMRETSARRICAEPPTHQFMPRPRWHDPDFDKAMDDLGVPAHVQGRVKNMELSMAAFIERSKDRWVPFLTMLGMDEYFLFAHLLTPQSWGKQQISLTPKQSLYILMVYCATRNQHLWTELCESGIPDYLLQADEAAFTPGGAVSEFVTKYHRSFTGLPLGSSTSRMYVPENAGSADKDAHYLSALVSRMRSYATAGTSIWTVLCASGDADQKASHIRSIVSEVPGVGNTQLKTILVSLQFWLNHFEPPVNFFSKTCPVGEGALPALRYLCTDYASSKSSCEGSNDDLKNSELLVALHAHVSATSPPVHLMACWVSQSARETYADVKFFSPSFRGGFSLDSLQVQLCEYRQFMKKESTLALVPHDPSNFSFTFLIMSS